MNLHSCHFAPITDTSITLISHCPPPCKKSGGNEKETGCKIYLSTLDFSKQMSQNYLGHCYMGKKSSQIILKAVNIRITSVNYLITTIYKYFLESC